MVGKKKGERKKRGQQNKGRDERGVRMRARGSEKEKERERKEKD